MKIPCPRSLKEHQLLRKLSLTLLTAVTALALTATNVAPSSAAPNDEATDQDSAGEQWADVGPISYYVNKVRKTDRVSYPDAYNYPKVSCDVTGDGKTDMIFANPKTKTINIVDFIPKGDPVNGLEYSIEKQPGLVQIKAPQAVDSNKPYGTAIACIPSTDNRKSAGHPASIAVVGGSTLYILDSAQIAAPNGSKAGVITQTYLFPTNIKDLAVAGSYGENTVANQIFVTAGNIAYRIGLPTNGTGAESTLKTIKDAIDVANPGTSGAEIERYAAPNNASENLRVNGLPNSVMNHNGDDNKTVYAISAPTAGDVYLLNLDKRVTTGSHSLASEAAVIHGNGSSGTSSNFGIAVTGLSDLDYDGYAEWAIGAPNTQNDLGAVAIIQGGNYEEAVGNAASGKYEFNVYLESTRDHPVEIGNQDRGWLLRSNTKAKFGSSLTYVPPIKNHADNKLREPGGLLVGRPVDDEHPGALFISDRELQDNWNRGPGISAIPVTHIGLLTSIEGTESDLGTNVGLIPNRGEDRLWGLITSESSTGHADVWTVDMSRQSDRPTKPIDPEKIYPKPAPPKMKEEIGLIDKADEKLWRGPFSSGIGSALAKGSCDVTGDGKPDIIAGGYLSSQYYFNSYYAGNPDANNGWQNDVNGMISIIPGGSKASDLPQDQISPNSDLSKPFTIRGTKLNPLDSNVVDAALGFTVACAGDTNGDGIDDILTSANGTGTIWIIFGGETLKTVNLDKIDPKHGWKIDTKTAMGPTGWHVTQVGDVNGDGLADIGFITTNINYAAMSFSSPEHGSAFIFAGTKQPQNIDFSEFKIDTPGLLAWIDSPDHSLVQQFAPVGDVNGDGSTDYAIADYTKTDSQTGAVTGAAWVVYGPSTDQFKDSKAFHTKACDSCKTGFGIIPENTHSYRLGIGTSIAAAGDQNGDGLADFLVGYDGGNDKNRNEGGVALIYGKSDNKAITLDANSSSGKVTTYSLIKGPVSGSGFGYSVDYTEVNRSSAAPIKKALVGAQNMDEGNGRAYLIDMAAFTPGVHSIKDVAKEVTEYKSTAKALSRFGRSVAFIGNFFGSNPAFAVGGDGTIDSNGKEGFINASHVHAYSMVLPSEANSPTGDTSVSPISAVLAKTGLSGIGMIVWLSLLALFLGVLLNTPRVRELLDKHRL